MRDPGTARSNPLLGHETVEEPLDEAPNDPAGDDVGPGEDSSTTRDPHDRGSEPFPDDDWATLEDLLAPGSPGEAVVTALLEAGPEALEHLTAAGHELLLAAKTMIDAAERGLAEYRKLHEDTDGWGSTEDSVPDAEQAANVTHIDPR